MSLMELKNINVVFNKKGGLLGEERHIHVLKDINLDLKKGEILALVGESGCGKTTTGKVITGLLDPTSGQVLLDGKSLYGKRRRRAKKDTSVQFIQQDSYAALNPVKTIRQSLTEAIYCTGRHIKGDELDKKLDDLMSSIELTPAKQYLDKYPHNLSGGQRQRILMARAIVFDPKIIVADEPVSMIDVSLRLSILKLMMKLNEERGITFVYITHDLSTARYIANRGRICVMYLGQIVEEGDMEYVIQHPQHPYTKALVLAVPDLMKKENGSLPLKSMELASIENRVEGCSFMNRCIYATEKCTEKIDLYDSKGIKVRCIRYAEGNDGE